MVATTDSATLPDKATWYLATNLARPGGPRTADSPHPPANPAEIVRLYGIRPWVEQGYKQTKDELGWADFQVRSDAAIRRHQSLVHCAFSFCWHTWFGDHAPPDPRRRPRRATPERGGPTPAPQHPATQLAPDDPRRRPQLADPLDHAHTLVASMVDDALGR